MDERRRARESARRRRTPSIRRARRIAVSRRRRRRRATSACVLASTRVVDVDVVRLRFFFPLKIFFIFFLQVDDIEGWDANEKAGLSHFSSRHGRTCFFFHSFVQLKVERGRSKPRWQNVGEMGEMARTASSLEKLSLRTK